MLEGKLVLKSLHQFMSLRIRIMTRRNCIVCGFSDRKKSEGRLRFRHGSAHQHVQGLQRGRRATNRGDSLFLWYVSPLVMIHVLLETSQPFSCNAELRSSIVHMTWKELNNRSLSALQQPAEVQALRPQTSPEGSSVPKLHEFWPIDQKNDEFPAQLS